MNGSMSQLVKGPNSVIYDRDGGDFHISSRQCEEETGWGALLLFFIGCSRKKEYFPIFTNQLLFNEYSKGKKSQFDIMSVPAVVAIFYMAAVTRLSYYYLMISSGHLFFVALAFMITANIIFSIFVISHMLIYFTKDVNRTRSSYLCARAIISRSFFGRIEDVIAVTLALATGMYLMARVYTGQCQDMDNIWKSQTCNPVADAHSIPHDQVILMYTIPIVTQIVLRGVSIYALALSFMCAVIYVTLALLHVQGWAELWTLLYSPIFMNISFEIERSMRVSFIQNKLLVTATSLKLQQESDFNLLTMKNNHQIELLQISTESEKKLREVESYQLRSLMGNVAHDLKTPLHSIEADLEVLNAFITRIPKPVFDRTLAEFEENNSGSSLNPLSVFQSLSATCKFMAMAINRSQDFMKATNNIALKPALETFDLKAAVSMSVTCIDHLQSSRTIVVQPFGTRICSHLISDKHWFIENVLCLLSNAVKYSDNGVVDVRIRLIDSNPRDPTSVGEMSFMQCGDHTDDTKNSKSSSNQEPDAGAQSFLKEMIMLSVEDTGIGISEDIGQTLFQPFKQAQRMAGGTGLGLYSLSKRIEALGGSAGVTSRCDGMQGSMFWFTFPYRPDFSVELPEAATTEASETVTEPTRCPLHEDSLRPLRVLLVDDSLSILKVTSRLLSMRGHRVETVSNGFLGLKRLEAAYPNCDFDLVLTDLQMPVMDGFEATKRFRKFERAQMGKTTINTKDIDTESELNLNLYSPDSGEATNSKRLLIIGMSANSDSQSVDEAIESGMDYFLTKPFAYKDLLNILYGQHGFQKIN